MSLLNQNSNLHFKDCVLCCVDIILMTQAENRKAEQQQWRAEKRALVQVMYMSYGNSTAFH